MSLVLWLLSLLGRTRSSPFIFSFHGFLLIPLHNAFIVFFLLFTSVPLFLLLSSTLLTKFLFSLVFLFFCFSIFLTFNFFVFVNMKKQANGLKIIGRISLKIHFFLHFLKLYWKTVSKSVEDNVFKWWTAVEVVDFLFFKSVFNKI